MNDGMQKGRGGPNLAASGGAGIKVHDKLQVGSFDSTYRDPKG